VKDLVRAAAALCLIAVALAGCGGGSDAVPASGNDVASPTQPVSPDPVVNPAPGLRAGVGQVNITVTDSWGAPLHGATFGYACGSGTTVCAGGYATDVNGRSTLPDVRAGDRRILAQHPLGWKAASVTVTAGGTADLSLRIDPMLEPAALILSASLSGSLDAEGRERELRIRFAVSGAWDGSPDDGYQGARSWLSAAQVGPCLANYSSSPTPCTGEGRGWTAVDDYSLRNLPAAQLPSEREPFSALLLLDQGGRAPGADTGRIRAYAARNFLLSVRPDDEVALAGFAGDGDAVSPRQLPASPIWIASAAHPTFSTDHQAWAAGVDGLLALVGGKSPLYDALEAGMDRIAALVPATRRRSLVVLTAADDDGLLTDAQRTARWESLLQKKQASGIEIMVVAGHAANRDSPDRTRLADMAATGLASLVTTSFVSDTYIGGYFDDYYSGLDLAADLAVGRAPSYELTFRLRQATGPFQSGATIRGELILQDECEPAWWNCSRAVPFVVRVP
jgi:hypothetical protein